MIAERTGTTHQEQSISADHVSTVVHELRTPLSALKASLALLDGDMLVGAPETAAELLGVARRNTDRLLRLVDGMLELARIENRPVETALPVSLAGVVNEAVRSLSPLAAQQQVIVTTNVPDTLMVAGEFEGVQRIIVNLVGNAIKFSAGGHVDVSVIVREGTVFLNVCDNGEGIPEGNLATLFDRFQNVRASAAQQGTGLGLAITKALVTRFRGEISVQSELGRGTCFTVALPKWETGLRRERRVRERRAAFTAKN